MKNVIAVFDVGKTNKKFFLFDSTFQVCYQKQVELPLEKDDDNHPCESLSLLENWMKTTFKAALELKQFTIEALNFTGYGASLVHIDAEGKAVCPLYNYTKPYPKKLSAQFYKKYGPELSFSTSTGSFEAGMLNSGMQLFWLKHKKPKQFTAIKYSLHLPQYLSYMFSSYPVSDYTTIGCHTALWNYDIKEYHSWVNQEGMTSKLAPIVSSETVINQVIEKKLIKVGVGIHDSSAALTPYIKNSSSPFLLLSTGTWSVVFNPFSKSKLKEEEVSKGALYYMQVDGTPVRASRLFLGYQHTQFVKEVAHRYGITEGVLDKIKFNPSIYRRLRNQKKPQLNWIKPSQKHKITTELPLTSYEEEYHFLMIALVNWQVSALKLAQGDADIGQLFIEGGFNNNEIFLKLLCLSLPTMKIYSSHVAQGSALGAALMVSTASLPRKYFNSFYKISKQEAPQLDF